MKLLKSLVVLALVGIAIAAAVVWSGAYNVGADDPHWSATYRVLEVARQRSIAVRAAAWYQATASGFVKSTNAAPGCQWSS